MTDAATTTRDYSKTLFLPVTDFPMRAGLPQKEPEILAHWAKIGLYGRLRSASEGRAKFVLHDGPPYANGHIHIGHALNKVLKDLVTRSQQMLGFDSNYVPGWDCHGLPIEWKIEEENYRKKGKAKPDLSDPAAMIAFRQECRRYAEHWLSVQREEFKRLGVVGDWDHPYTTMSFAAEAQIAREIMKFARNGMLYRGSKPVMWSVVERTALAEAEVEYEDFTSDTVWVKFPVRRYAGETSADAGQLAYASVVIWTTTPWTLPGNRAISFSHKIGYGLYKVTDAPADNWARTGDLLILADKLAEDVFKQARVVAFEKVRAVPADDLAIMACDHPLKGLGYDFAVPMLDGEHVDDSTGTGFVHTAPGHGREDFEIWMEYGRRLAERGISTRIPYTVDADGRYTADAPGFEGRRVITEKGEKGDANEAVIKALVDAGNLVARGKLKHQYPHSWRSKKPVIFRNTPQWFIAMDQPILSAGKTPPAFDGLVSAIHRDVAPEVKAAIGSQFDTLRARALKAIRATRWVPPQGQNRITGMIESRPDWVISRQRAWGVPITVFVRDTGHGEVEILRDDAVDARVVAAFEQEGADAWYAAGARERFLGERAAEGWQKVDDILDVWFDSGSTHAFVLEDPENFATLAGIRRKVDGGRDQVMYLEGSDQHRGWFHSSLLESCGTRGRAPFDVVVTHGFTLDEQGRKMSKSLGNTVAPQDLIKQHGADIVRLWVGSCDYWDDQRIGPEIIKTTVDTYRKLRNTLRWMLGNLAHFRDEDRVKVERMPPLERYMLHRLAELDATVREAYANFDYKRIFAVLSQFMTVDLSAFYFDVRKDALYCDPISSLTRKSCLTVLDHVFRCTVTWLAPILCFTAEEAWLARYAGTDGSVHLETFPDVPESWRNEGLAETWRKARAVRRVVTGALELERAAKRIGSSLEADPLVYVGNDDLFRAVVDLDLAEICITSGAQLLEGKGPEEAFRLPDVPGVAVLPRRAEGRKCARSWKITPTVGADPQYPDVTPRDAQALRELDALSPAAE
ncbi:isoleucine--tRNA ligase [Rhodoplanes sp. TEM]|uniref:Isoleucine--tRNA ligase n=1 Tax=Rhodoplanes tepidamans TaxID=200616 RepID=A0ABT5JIJ3_RHOTP|nr:MULTISPECIES: isoleucine--tRNA ligase [Rhodoplanes]MDC7789352.1 isoleucine--tRNA ligase [Rhodoplanes tepidamans]MDC7987151.1 isoleucine--tRNA ligase [Rhodoplanes sp. TEM]MDQ0358489.1 isoleucyl-tRNA synthetase [Rhodoplanes tepidamans]